MDKKIVELFNKYAGKVISMYEGYNKVTNETLFLIPMNNPEPVFEEMKQLAADNGIKLRIWLSPADATRDQRPDRLNVMLEKGDDGKFRISNQFGIG